MIRPIILLLLLVGSACGKEGPPAADVGIEDMGSVEVGMTPDTSDDCTVRRAPGTTLTDPRGEVTVEVELDADCVRTYRISSTAARRDNEPASPRTITERPEGPTLRTGNALVDGLYAMTLEEVRDNSVEAISDGAFASGQPIDCPDGGCFETGARWHYVWTRDISYALDLGLAALDPVRAQNSLLFKVSERRGGGDRQVMQDTGTGGSYPVSTDRVVWALGAEAVLDQLDGAQADAFAATAFDALINTIRHDRAVGFDETTGLYRGEQSFLDWREQSYPAWVEGEPVHIATSKSLSTNLVHFRALTFTSALADRLGESEVREELNQWASELRTAIVEHLWMEDAGLFSTFIVDELDQAPSRQFDLLGSSLAVLFGVAGENGARILDTYPHAGVGAPVIFPQQQFTRIYHNRAEWPFVSAYWLRAASRVRNDAVATRMTETLIRGAALNLSNMENWEIVSGAPWVDDGEYSGPVVNSQRQLWSVAAFVSLVHHTIFGLEPRWEDDGLRVRPTLARAVRTTYFADAESLQLRGYPYRGNRLTVVLNLPPDEGGDGFYEIADIRVDGEQIMGEIIDTSLLLDGATIAVNLTVGGAPSQSAIHVVDAENWQELFAPRPPSVTLAADTTELVVTMQTDDDPATMTWSIWRDGTQVADGLPATTSEWRTPLPTDTSPCFVVETCFVDTPNCSQRSLPQCWWGDSGERIVTYDALAFTNTGGVLSDEHGRSHWSQWGDPGHRLSISGVQPATTGPALIQLGYGNGAGPVDTGITCAVKHVTITDEADDAVVGDGYLVMPHLGDWSRWSLSSFLEAPLDATRTYRVDISSDDRAINMSAFEHFARYAGEGGAATFNRVNIAELRVLSR